MVKLSESAYSLQSIAFDFPSIIEKLGGRGESDEPNRKYNNIMDFMQSEVQCYGMFRIKKLRNWLWCYGNQNQRTLYEERIRSELQKTYEILQPFAEDVSYNRDPMYPNRLQQCPMWLLTEYTDIWDICEMLADSIDSTDGTKRITSKEYSETGALPGNLLRLRHILKNTFNGRCVSSAQVREQLGFEPSRLFAPSKKVIDRPIELRKKHFQETLRGPWQWRE